MDIFCEQFLDECNAWKADIGVMKGVSAVNSFLDFFKDLGIGAAIERCTTCEHSVEDAANRPKITLFVKVSLDDFGCDVVGSAQGPVQVCRWQWSLQQLDLFVANGRLRLVEVNKLDIAFNAGEEQDVLGFQVHVDNLVFVKLSYATEYLRDHKGGIFL